MKSLFIAALASAALCLAPTATAQVDLGTRWTYQARITSGGAPLSSSADLRFSLWDGAAGGSQLGPMQTVSEVAVTDGLFTVELDFGEVFRAEERYLEIEVRSPHDPTDTAPYTTLTPRRPVTAAPYALALGGLVTTPSDDPGFPRSWNVVGGHPLNSAGAGVAGATVAGGGKNGGGNSVNADFGTICGGHNNSVGGDFATIGGGTLNNAGHAHATISGGWQNMTTDSFAVIGGGTLNQAARYATVAGGHQNLAIGSHAIIAGGHLCTASGTFTYAAGRRAKAVNNGTWVWADNNDVDFTSTGVNQFLIRAGGGMGVNTNDPSNSLTVAGSADITGSLGVGIAAPTTPLHVVGDATVTGTLTKGGGSFRIDHPLDPLNKYLSHSFVESPDMMNIYNGNIMTDEAGYATVELPDWFEALNRDYRYQLTVIDEADSDSFVMAKVVRGIEGGRFVVRTSEPSEVVSWQVTGIRRDAYANAHRITVEQEKPEGERGTHLHPEAFGGE